MAKKRVYNFDSYNDKIDEGYENPGFIVNEFEEENETNIDNLGEGEALVEEAPADEVVEEEPQVEDTLVDQPDAEIPNATAPENLDFGDRQDLSEDEIRIKMNFIQDQLKSYTNLVKNMENVRLDKTTKEKIIKIYNVMQGI